MDVITAAYKAVALRKESVDRNSEIPRGRPCPLRSLSARRAWIEMLASGVCLTAVASLSARRAWIEIFFLRSCFFGQHVALRKESVDRNIRGIFTGDWERASLSARRAWIEMAYAPPL